jgi:hypothetical protein
MHRKTFAQDNSWSCSCGAIAEQQHGLCRKCYAGMTWRRHTSGSARKTSRRRRGRLSRERARILSVAATMTGSNGSGADF